MANRSNAVDVKAVIPTSLTNSEVTSFLSDANTLVTEILSGEDLSDSILEIIEKWVCAHLISVSRSRQAQYKKIGDASESYAKLGVRMESTTYGQTAISFDTSGKLANIGKKRIIIEAIPSFDDSPIL